MLKNDLINIMSRESMMPMESIAQESSKSEKKNEGGSELTPVEYKEGLPVITGKQFEHLYNTDIRAFGSHSAATFDFQGFVRDEGNVSQKVELAYRDVLATNGLLKGGNHKGIHIGIDGIANYWQDKNNMQSADEIREYDVYVSIPAEIQKKHGCFCRDDGIEPASGYDSSDDEPTVDDYYRTNKEGSVLVRLMMDPHDDKYIRDKIRYINSKIIEFIEKCDEALVENDGSLRVSSDTEMPYQLHKLKAFIEELKRKVVDISPEDLEKRMLKS